MIKNNYFINEQCVIGSLMIMTDLSGDAAQKVLSMLKPTSFQDARHKTVFNMLSTLSTEGSSADFVMVNARLQQAGQLDAVGGIAYLADLQQAVPSSANIMAYADLVRQNSIRTVINSKMQSALAEFNDLDDTNVYQKLGQLESMISTLGQRASSGRESGLTHIKEIGKEWFDELQDRKENPEAHQGVSSGIDSIDEVLGPKLLRPGSLFVVGARPKMGKTAYLEAICRRTAIDQGGLTGIFSLEMPNFQLYERFLSSESKVNSDKYHSVQLTDYEWQTTSSAIGRFNGSNLYMDDTPSISLQYLKKEARKLAKNGNVKLIAVDYLTLMEAGKEDTNSLAYGMITKGLKALAKELDCVVLLLTQLNRNLEQRSDKRPIPADSRDTGQIEQDADYWMGLYREAVYNDDLQPNQKGLTEAIIRLNRHGGTGTGYMDMKQGYFENTAPFSFETKKTNKNNDF